MTARLSPCDATIILDRTVREELFQNIGDSDGADLLDKRREEVIGNGHLLEIGGNGTGEADLFFRHNDITCLRFF